LDDVAGNIYHALPMAAAILMPIIPSPPMPAMPTSVKGLADYAGHVIRRLSTQPTKVQNELGDVVGSIDCEVCEKYSHGPNKLTCSFPM